MAPPDAFYGTCVRAESTTIFERPEDRPMMGEAILSCIDDLVGNGGVQGIGDPVPAIYIGDSSEVSCRKDKVFECEPKGEQEVACKVRIANSGPRCEDSSVDVKIHGLCCYPSD
jgi:hypothetical protein